MAAAASSSSSFPSNKGDTNDPSSYHPFPISKVEAKALETLLPLSLVGFPEDIYFPDRELKAQMKKRSVMVNEQYLFPPPGKNENHDDDETLKMREKLIPLIEKYNVQFPHRDFKIRPPTTRDIVEAATAFHNSLLMEVGDDVFASTIFAYNEQVILKGDEKYKTCVANNDAVFFDKTLDELENQ